MNRKMAIALAATSLLALVGCGALEDAFASITATVSGPTWLTAAQYNVKTKDGSLYAQGTIRLNEGAGQSTVKIPAEASLVVEGQRDGFTYYEAMVEKLIPGRTYHIIFGSEHRKKKKLSVLVKGLEAFSGAEVQICAPAPAGGTGVSGACGEGWELLATLQPSDAGPVETELPTAPRYRAVAVYQGAVIDARDLPEPAPESLLIQFAPKQLELHVESPPWLSRVRYELRNVAGQTLASGDASGGEGRWTALVPVISGYRIIILGYATDAELPCYEADIDTPTDAVVSYKLGQEDRVLISPTITLVNRQEGFAFDLAICAVQPTGWPPLDYDKKRCPNGYDLLALLPFPPDSHTVVLPLMSNYRMRAYYNGQVIAEMAWDQVRQTIWLFDFNEF